MARVYEKYFSTRLKAVKTRDVVWNVICLWLSGRFIQNNSVVLDLGCGQCSFINNVQAKERFAVDFLDAREYAGPGVKFTQASATKLPGAWTGKFDFVFCSNLLEHLTLEEAAEGLDEARRVLKKGGRLALLQPNFRLCTKEYFDDYTHKTVFTDKSLKGLVESRGFKVIYLKPGFLPYSMEGKPTFPGWLTKLATWFYLRSPFRPFAGQMLLVAKK